MLAFLDRIYKIDKILAKNYPVNVTFAPPSTKRIIGNLVGTTPHWGGENSTFQGNAVVFTPSLMVLAPRSVLIQL
jgi:hypothetical protein